MTPASNRPKVLLVSLRAPWPIVSGGGLRGWQILNLLRPVAEAGLFSVAGPEEPPSELAGIPWRVASGLHDLPGKDDHRWVARPEGLPSDVYCSEEVKDQLAAMIADFQPSVVILEQCFVFSLLEPIQAAGVPFIYNSHNVEADLAAALAQEETSLPLKLLRKKLADRLEHIERSLVSDAAQTWVCSRQDREAYLRLCESADIHIVPNAIDLERYRAPQSKPAACDGPGPLFIFPATFSYPPNLGAAEFLLNRLWPHLREEHPQSRLLLVGDAPTPAMQVAAAQDGRIIVTGRVPEVVPYLQHSTMLLAPLFVGGGTRFKLLEAFAANLPVISTPKGAEGLEVEDGRHLLLANDETSFLKAIRETLADPNATRARTQQAQAFVERYGWNAAQQTVIEALAQFSE